MKQGQGRAAFRRKKVKHITLTSRIDAVRRKVYAAAALRENRAGDVSVRSLSTWVRKHLDKASGYVE